METIKKNKIENIVFILLCISIFAYGIAYPIMKLWMFCAVAGIFAIYFAFQSKRIEMDVRIIALIIVMAMIYYHDVEYYIEGETFKVATPIIAFILGSLIVGNRKATANTRVKWAVLSITLGIFVQGVIDFVEKIAAGEATEKVGYNLYGIQMARTALEADLLPMAAMFPVGIIIWRNRKDIKILILTIIVELFLLFLSLKCEGRYSISLMALSTIVVMAVYFFNEWLNLNRSFKKWLMIIICVAIGSGLIGLVAFKLNLFGIYDIYENSYFSRDGGIIHNVRFSMMARGWYNLKLYPLGGWKNDWEGWFTSTHDMWLEYGREFGMSVFLVLGLYLLLTIKDILILSFSRKSKGIEKYMLLAAFIAFNTFYFFEGYSLSHLRMPDMSGLADGAIKAKCCALLLPDMEGICLQR
mgnify:CR=1 FL=1